MNTWLLLFLAVILGSALAASLRFQWWRIPRKGLGALMYHHIGLAGPKDEQFPFTITPQRFEEQLLLLEKLGFTPITFSELQKAQKSGQKYPAKPILLTFDDGYLDNYTALFPLLKKRRVKANIFLTVNKIGAEADYMTWEHVLEMQKSGLVEFGSHTLTHRRLRSLSDEEIAAELVGSKKALEEKLGRPVTAFCYPYGAGAFDKRVRPAVFKAGYLFDFSTKKGINPWPWNPRKTILRAFPRGGETLLDFYLQITRGKSQF